MAGRSQHHHVKVNDTGKVNDVKNFGPVPRNYVIKRAQKSYRKNMVHAAKYKAKGTNTFLTEHPRSPANRQARVPVEDEQIQPKPAVGVFHPPFIYKTAQWLWTHHDTWQAALADGLAVAGITKGPNAVDVQDVNDALAKLKEPEKMGELYHPTDRGTAVFKDEVLCSGVARNAGKSSLVIVCPEVASDASDWDNIWQEESRPDLRARWSTGPQSCNKIVVLGCIPVWFEAKTRQVLWFTLRPTGEFERTWNTVSGRLTDNTTRPQILQLMKDFHIHSDVKIESFQWLLVAAHRSAVLDIDDVPRSNSGELRFGSWIKQYSDHILRCKQQKKQMPFAFTDKKKYGGRELNFFELTMWITSSTVLRGHANTWDAAIAAYVTYMQDQTDANWKDFETKMSKARKVPM